MTDPEYWSFKALSTIVGAEIVLLSLPKKLNEEPVIVIE
jgi:hypothetical protein